MIKLFFEFLKKIIFFKLKNMNFINTNKIIEYDQINKYIYKKYIIYNFNSTLLLRTL